MSTESYKLEKIELENYKKFKALVLIVNGENLSVTGTTDQGKTTVVTSLWEIIEMVGEPVTTGESKGRIKITLNSHTGKKVFAERRFTEKTKNISIIDSEGNKISAKDFKEWFCSLANNPQDLKNLRPTELVKTLTQCVTFPPGFDLDALDAAIEQNEDTRKELKQEVKLLEKNLGETPENVPFRDIVVVTEELQAEQKLADTKKSTEDNLKKADERITAITTRKEALNKELADLNTEEAELKAWRPTAVKWLADTVVDVEAKQQAVYGITAHNAKAQAFLDHGEKVKAIEAKRAQVVTFDTAITRDREQRKANLEAATWPLPGLCIEDGQVYYNHVPFEQVGDSKKMLICAALAAEQIKNSPLKIVRMDATESMSKEDFNTTVQIFNAHGIQVLSTRVSRAGEVEPGELVIHDGGLL